MPDLAQADRRFLLRWVMATTLTVALCSLMGPVGLLVGPLPLAIAQGLALRCYWDRAALWSIATLAGGYSALVVFFGLYFFAPLPLSATLLLSGAVIGWSQAMVLRGLTRFWGLWPVLSGLLLWLSLGGFVVTVTNAVVFGTARPWWHWLAQATLIGLMGSPLAGLALIWVLKPSRRRTF